MWMLCRIMVELNISVVFIVSVSGVLRSLISRLVIFGFVILVLEEVSVFFVWVLISWLCVMICVSMICVVLFVLVLI